MKDNSLVLDINEQTANERELLWIYHRLESKRPFAPKEIIPSTSEEYSDAILNLINGKHFEDLTDRNHFIKLLRKECASNLLDSSDFQWINIKDERLCTWLWLYIHMYHELIPSVNSSTTVTKYKDVIKHIDLMKSTRHEKLTFLYKLKSRWNNELKKTGRLTWLDSKNALQCEWALKYIEKNKGIPQLCSNIKDNYCGSDYLKVTASLDHWIDSLENKGKFVNKMELAWKQKKIRLSVKSKSQKIKVNLPQDSLLMLNEVSKLYEHKNINATLKLLIKKEYKKLKDSWQKSVT